MASASNVPPPARATAACRRQHARPRLPTMLPSSSSSPHRGLHLLLPLLLAALQQCAAGPERYVTVTSGTCASNNHFVIESEDSNASRDQASGPVLRPPTPHPHPAPTHTHTPLHTQTHALTPAATGPAPTTHHRSVPFIERMPAKWDFRIGVLQARTSARRRPSPSRPALAR